MPTWAWRIAACLTGLLLGAGGLPLVSAQTPAAAEFFRAPTLEAAKLSPTGRHMAATRYVESIQRHALVLVNLEGERQARVIAAHRDADVRSFHWVGGERLVYTLGDRKASEFHTEGAGLYAIGIEPNASAKVLIKRRWDEFGEANVTGQAVHAKVRDTALDPTHRFHSVVRDGSGKVLVVRGNFTGEELTSTVLMRMDTVSGRSEVVSKGAPERVTEWLSDATGTPRVAVGTQGDRSLTYYRPNAETEWRVLHDSPAYGLDLEGYEVLAVGEGEQLFIRQAAAGPAEHTVLATQRAGEASAKSQVILSAPGYDFQGRLVRSGDRVVGLHHLTETWGSHWFDPTMKAAQQKVDQLLSSTVNVLDCGACVDPKRVLVWAFSDRQPGVYYLYDVASQKIEPVSATRPWIKPQDMAAMGVERVPARDGLPIPLYLTLPRQAKGPAPTVVLVHGGPFVRGAEWAWDAEAQFLAAQGYAVLQPEFRGSLGYGARLAKAGFKQWGQGMIDDLADVTRWAITQGHTDPKRICIMGGSYGGYATLMGLARYPDLFRCGVESFGVTDLNLLYTSAWSDATAGIRQHYLPERMGDRVKDAAMLAADSPVNRAEQIKQPLLMLHGRQDRRVPIEHGDRMHAALAKHNAQVQRKVYADEGHGIAGEANRLDYWTRVAQFLASQLGAR